MAGHGIGRLYISRRQAGGGRPDRQADGQPGGRARKAGRQAAVEVTETGRTLVCVCVFVCDTIPSTRLTRTWIQD